MIDKVLFDLSRRFSLGQHLADKFAPITAGIRRTNIQRCIFTNRAKQLPGDGIDIVVRGGRFLGTILRLEEQS